ncbi:g6712 [Coccomyxa viridis]|uniref:G6712 protein n=1 Tax=Coccomyxa viridis TaxID=1274662 RepID=A0ABP1FW28_9CHLO
MGAEIVLPPALMRDSFGKYYSMTKEKNETPISKAFPDFTMPDEAWPVYSQSEEEQILSIYLNNMYLKVEASTIA